MAPAEETRPPMAKLARIDLLLVVVIGLLVQAYWASRLTEPTYMDAYYYTTNGQRLVDGHGFTEQIIWQFLDDPDGLPAPSHTYWMPLASILASAGYAVRDDFRGAQSLFWLLGGLLPLLAYMISWQLVRERWQAWVAALFTALGGFYAAFIVQPSTFAPFALAGGLCLLALGLAKARRGWWFVAGLTAGLAHLARADGLFLFLVALLIWFMNAFGRQRAAKTGRANAPASWLADLLLLLVGYLLVMGGWFLHNWSVLGRPLPTAGAQSIFLTSYNDLFAYGRSFNLGTLLDWGIENILRSRLQGIWVAVQTFTAVTGLIFLVPFIIAGLVGLYRQTAARALLRPVVLYTLALFISAGLLFTFPGMRGSLFHSSAALWPWFMALAAAGIGFAVDWAAARLTHWRPERAKRLFSAMFIVVALVLTLFVSQYRVIPDEDPDAFRRIGEVVPASSVVMVGNAPALHYYTSLPAVSVPNEPPDVLLEAADRYGVTHLALNRSHPLPLNDLYQARETHPRLRLVESFDDMRIYELVSSP